jgi:hypothetical protein
MQHHLGFSRFENRLTRRRVRQTISEVKSKSGNPVALPVDRTYFLGKPKFNAAIPLPRLTIQSERSFE